MRFPLHIPVFVLTVALSSSARSQTRDPAVATELFNAGRDLMKSGDYTAACPKLAASARLDAKVGTLARLAECEEKVGLIAGARGHWQQAENLARADQDPRLAHVQAEFARVDKVVPKVKVWPHEPLQAGLSLAIDNLDVGAASFGVALPVEPGSHTVIVAAPGKKNWAGSFQTKADGAVVLLTVPALEDAPPSAMAAPVLPLTPTQPVFEPSGAASQRPSTLPIVGLVTGGLGVVALGFGTAFGVVAKNDLNDSNAQGCSGSNCREPGFGLRNDARSAGNISTVLFVAGGVLATSGVVMWLLAPKAARGPSGSGVAVGVGAGTAVLGGRF